MQSKGYTGIGMEGFIARSYDKSARRNMKGLYRNWAKKLSRQILDESNILEVGPGPGYLSIELSKLCNYKITGLDVSETFVEIANKNAVSAGVKIDFQKGNVSAMPFPDKQFDFLICTSSFKNFSEPVEALNEMYRVLKPGGKVWISDLRKNISDDSIDCFVTDTLNMNGLGGLFTKYTFKHTLRPRAYTAEQFRELISKSLFRFFRIKENDIDIEICLWKYARFH